MLEKKAPPIKHKPYGTDTNTPTKYSSGHHSAIQRIGGRKYIKCDWNTSRLYGRFIFITYH